MSSPLAIQDMPYVVLYTGLEYPAKMEENLSQHDIANYTAKRHQLVCWQASFSVNWAVGGVCKVFACLLGSKLTSFGTELLIAALSTSFLTDASFFESTFQVTVNKLKIYIRNVFIIQSKSVDNTL